MISKSNRWGVKLFILASSVVGMLGGWAALAADQVTQANALQPGTARGELSQPATRQQSAPAVQPTQVAPRQQLVAPTPQPVQPQNNLRQAPNTTFQPRARTRSSR